MFDYINEAIKTESTSWYETNQRLFHAALGIMTEIIEVGDVADREEYQDEMGDIFWYLAVACDELGVTFEDLEDEEVDGAVDSFYALLIHAGEFVDLFKKATFYGRPFDKAQVLPLIAKLYKNACRDLEFADCRLDEVLAANIDKLRKRYGANFSEASANNR